MKIENNCTLELIHCVRPLPCEPSFQCALCESCPTAWVDAAAGMSWLLGNETEAPHGGETHGS